jgi:hypothetical protein
MATTIITKDSDLKSMGVNALTTMISSNLLSQADKLNVDQMKSEIALATTAAFTLLNISPMTNPFEAAKSSVAADEVATNAGKLRRLMAAISFVSNGTGITAANLPLVLADNLKRRVSPSVSLANIASFMADPEGTIHPVAVEVDTLDVVVTDAVAVEVMSTDLTAVATETKGDTKTDASIIDAIAESADAAAVD